MRRFWHETTSDGQVTVKGSGTTKKHGSTITRIYSNIQEYGNKNRKEVYIETQYSENGDYVGSIQLDSNKNNSVRVSDDGRHITMICKPGKDD